MNALKKYIEEYGVTIPFLSKKTGYSKASLYKAMKPGKMPLLPLALELEKATAGILSCEKWVEGYVKPNSKPRKPYKKRQKKENTDKQHNENEKTET